MTRIAQAMMATRHRCRMCGSKTLAGASECPKCGEELPNAPTTNERSAPLPHSGPGIASFSFGIFAWTVMGWVFGFGPPTLAERLFYSSTNSAFLVGMASLLACGVFGILGLLLPNRNPTFAYLGMALFLIACALSLGMILLVRTMGGGRREVMWRS